jgi:predicted amidohydrolase
MRAVLVQATPVPGDVEANVASACAAIEAAAGVDLIAFPELFLGGYRIRDVRPVGEDILARIGATARAAGTTVVIGGCEQVDGGFANSAFVLDRSGELAGIYRKSHLFGSERGAFVPGGELEPIAAGGRRLGLLICFDVEFPEAARTLVLRGADVLVTISANMAPFGDDHHAFVLARALENERPHLYVNRTGGESGADFVGRSMAVDADGRVLAAAGLEPATLEVDVPPAGRRDERTRYLAQRRPELYV